MGAEWYLIERVCRACGAAFLPTRNHQVFCQDRCRNGWNARRNQGKWHHPCVECGTLVYPTATRCRVCYRASVRPASKVCPTCGRVFDRKRTARHSVLQPERKYCSRNCALRQGDVTRQARAVARRAEREAELAARPPRACQGCGQILTALRTQWCSDECHKRTYSERQRVDAAAASVRPTCTCRECGRVFTPVYGDKRRQYCSDECGIRHVKRVQKGKRRARVKRLLADRVDPFEVFEAAGWKCEVCGVDTPRELRGSTDPHAPELDHIVPLAVGGSHSLDNVRCACRSCNNWSGRHVSRLAHAWLDSQSISEIIEGW